MARLPQFLLAGVMTLLLSACGLMKEASLQGQCLPKSALPRLLSNTTGVQAFGTTAHPALRISCAGCHSSATRIGPGNFGDKDVSASYFDASRKMVFSDVMNSRLYQKGTDGHCGSCDAAKNKTAFASVLQTWASAEMADPNAEAKCEIATPTPTPTATSSPTPTPEDTFPGVIFSTPINLPAGLVSSATTFARVRIPLDSLGFTGSLLELGVQKYTDAVDNLAPTYLFAEPRIYAKNSSLYFKGLRVYLNSAGRRHTNNGFSTVEAIIPKAAAGFNPNPVPLATASLSAQSDILIGFVESGVKIEVSFDAMVADIASAPEETVFAALVSPILVARCQNCHGSGRAFDLSGTVSEDRVETLNYVSKSDGVNSSLLRYARDGQSHPGGTPLAGRTADINSILTWINRLP